MSDELKDRIERIKFEEEKFYDIPPEVRAARGLELIETYFPEPHKGIFQQLFDPEARLIGKKRVEAMRTIFDSQIELLRKAAKTREIWFEAWLQTAIRKQFTEWETSLLQVIAEGEKNKAEVKVEVIKQVTSDHLKILRDIDAFRVQFNDSKSLEVIDKAEEVINEIQEEVVKRIKNTRIRLDEDGRIRFH